MPAKKQQQPEKMLRHALPERRMHERGCRQTYGQTGNAQHTHAERERERERECSKLEHCDTQSMCESTSELSENLIGRCCCCTAAKRFCSSFCCCILNLSASAFSFIWRRRYAKIQQRGMEEFVFLETGKTTIQGEGS